MGPTSRVFEVHKAVLCQSPVLAGFCSANSKESHRQTYSLPDHNADTFGRLLEYLYSHDYDPEKKTNAKDVALELADMYIMAERYQLNLLKAIVIDRFRETKTRSRERRITSLWKGPLTISESPIALIAASRRIYNNVPESDTEFRAYFKSTASHCLLDLSAVEVVEFLDTIDLKSLLGKDLLRALNQHLRDLQASNTRRRLIASVMDRL